MIGFQLTEEQEHMRKLAHRFAEEEIRPVATRYDESEQMPWPVIKKAARIGLTSFRYPEGYGGGGVESLYRGGRTGLGLPWDRNVYPHPGSGCDPDPVVGG